jgi:thymidylate synthase (FAD)
MVENGFSRKDARGTARAVLPNCVETKIVVTGNMRAWRDMLRKRLSPHAEVEIRTLAVEILRQLKDLNPDVFADFE